MFSLTFVNEFEKYNKMCIKSVKHSKRKMCQFTKELSVKV